MKNNPFRSNAISRRTDRQTELQRAVSLPPLPAQTKTKERGGVGWRDHSKGRGSGWGRSQDIRMMAGGGGWGGVRGGDIAGLAPSELDIKSPCQVPPTLKDT